MQKALEKGGRGRKVERGGRREEGGRKRRKKKKKEEERGIETIVK
jgi:hypothetical protein